MANDCWLALNIGVHIQQSTRIYRIHKYNIPSNQTVKLVQYSTSISSAPQSRTYCYCVSVYMPVCVCVRIAAGKTSALFHAAAVAAGKVDITSSLIKIVPVVGNRVPVTCPSCLFAYK